MTIARVLPVIVAVSVLAGCAGAPAAAPTPTETATTTPTATPTPTADPEPAATTITIGGRSTIITDQDGASMFEIVYSAPDAATIETVTALLGSEPTTEEVRRGAATDAFVGTVYSWEDGFSIAWAGKWEDEPGSGYPSVYVAARAASVGGAAVQTPDGFTVGQTGDLAARFPDSSYTGTTRDGVQYTQAWLNCIPIGIPDAADCVAVSTTPSDGPLTGISAPYQLNHGL